MARLTFLLVALAAAMASAFVPAATVSRGSGEFSFIERMFSFTQPRIASVLIVVRQCPLELMEG